MINVFSREDLDNASFSDVFRITQSGSDAYVEISTSADGMGFEHLETLKGISASSLSASDFSGLGVNQLKEILPYQKIILRPSAK